MKNMLFIAIALMLSTTVFGDEPDNSQAVAKRAEVLKTNRKSFQLALAYDGQSDKPYYSLLLSVPTVNVKRSSPFALVTQIDDVQALKIIAHLADTGILGRASEKGDKTKPAQSGYQLFITADTLQLTAPLGWDREMLKTLDGIKKVLDGDAAKDMDTLLGRLSGHRKQWDAAAK